MNPFAVKTPETLNSDDIASLFIDVYTDFPRLLAQEHTFLNGARGTGKSMMLRYLEPQVQIAAHKVNSASDLSHYAIHVPIKSPYYAISELERLEGSPYWLLAEHFMICNMALTIVASLKTIMSDIDKTDSSEFQTFYNKFLAIAGSDNAALNTCNNTQVEDFLDAVSVIINDERGKAKTYLTELAFNKEFKPYESSLYDYEDFFLPFIRIIKSLEDTPDGPVFLMLDDADNLPVRMQNILNTWVSYRTTDDICLKASTQQRYKTWRTTQGVLIERTHDFSEIDISTVYTSKHSHYFDRVKSIVERRLKVNGIQPQDPISFFPENIEQNSKLEAIKERISEDWEKGKRVSSRKSDDVLRYTVSEYMKELLIPRKKNTYSYAGFKSLVDISSGVIRNFLEPASRMSAEIEATGESEITQIPTTVQDQVIYKWSEEYMLEEFENLRRDESSKHTDKFNKAEKLKNLIDALGECFHRKLISNDTERRIFSFMVTNPLTPDIQSVMTLAIEWGYLSMKSIARKERAGRNISYTLNRRLAPYFKLDPSGYAAHLSLTPEHIDLATKDPQRFVRERLQDKQSDIGKQDKQGLLDI